MRKAEHGRVHPLRRRLVQFVVSSEHASRAVPTRWRYCFPVESKVLETHRAYDMGARELAQALAKRFHAPLVSGRATRLLVDLNRPLYHPGLFSEFTRGLQPERKRRLVTEFHEPHWTAVSQAVDASLAKGHTVVHLSVHSFTPRLGRQQRTADVGLLYDPARSAEVLLCGAWQHALSEDAPELRVRRNYPYRGAGSGLTSSLRKALALPSYLGIELEVNQRLVGYAGRRVQLEATLSRSLRRAVSATGQVITIKTNT